MIRLLALIALLLPAPALAEDWVTYTVDAPFEDVAFELDIAIEERGYVVDHVSHVGEMLNRTAADVGATETIYEQANVYLFCSATLSREMMEADVNNIAFCPYSVFLYQEAGSEQTTVGYPTMPEGAMQKVQSLLDEVARQAAGMD